MSMAHNLDVYANMEDDLQKIMQPKTIKSKNNGCGTAPGNLVIHHILASIPKLNQQRPQCDQLVGI